MPSPVGPRPLRDILFDLSFRDKPVTKALAEEAVKAVAADGLITRDEVDALAPYADGVGSSAKDRARAARSWKEGTAAGRALFNGLADACDALYSSANFESRQREPAPSFNPFGWWMGGWAGTSRGYASDKPAAVTGAALLKRTREEGTGWMYNQFEDLLRAYPKATNDRYSMTLTPKREVETAYNKLKADWMKGKITNERDLVADLKPLLESKYR